MTNLDSPPDTEHHWARPPAVAGLFYPADPGRLSGDVDRLLLLAGPPPDGAPPPKVLIVPHAGFVYSGPVAARGYALVPPWRSLVERVVLIGPAHRSPVLGVAVTSADALLTPLGLVPVDVERRAIALSHPATHVDDRAHAPEHCLEVQLPFLQRVLPGVPVLPLLAGQTPTQTVADVLELVWGGPETLVVVSTDLSHYHDHATAGEMDRRTAAAIVSGDHASIRWEDACGAVPVRGALAAAGRRGLTAELLELKTSADTIGPPDRVVGYGAFALR